MTAQRHSLPFVLRKLLVGLALRCPSCEQGATFKGLFRPEPTCAVCGVRFERRSGESVGGMYFNLVAAELITIGGFFLTWTAVGVSIWVQAIFWAAFNILFVVLFYRHSRSLWVAVSYLGGGLQTDADHQRQAQQ